MKIQHRRRTVDRGGRNRQPRPSRVVRTSAPSARPARSAPASPTSRRRPRSASAAEPSGWRASGSTCNWISPEPLSGEAGCGSAATGSRRSALHRSRDARPFTQGLVAGPEFPSCIDPSGARRGLPRPDAFPPNRRSPSHARPICRPLGRRSARYRGRRSARYGVRSAAAEAGPRRRVLS